MSQPDTYAADKLAAHPDVLERMRRTDEGRLLTVHLMPQNLCNQGCAFCSYRLPGNKNSSQFQERSHIPAKAMGVLLEDLEELGVLGVEVTGGGEPLLYPHSGYLWGELGRRPFATALVTNGTMLAARPDLLRQVTSSGLKWARVSIDSARRETYATMRRCPRRHFDLAWEAVTELRKNAPVDPEFRLGAAFTLSNENLREVFDFVHMARSSGADNVRLSVAYSDYGLGYFKERRELEYAVAESEMAVNAFDCPEFRVHNLIPRRVWEVEHPRQDYRRCPSKDLLCVVEGECKVYTCCTLTGTLHGLYGKFTEHPRGFRGLWKDAAGWRRRFDASSYCRWACLYRDRNLAMNELIDRPEEPPAVDGRIHAEFI